MISPGTKILVATALGAPLTAQSFTPIDDLDGMFSANLLAEVIGFTGGTSVSVIVGVTRDDGNTWLDVARFDFTGAGKKWVNLQRTAAKAIASYATLSGEGINDSLFGPTWGAFVTTVGTFTDTNLRVTLDAA